MRLLTRNAVWLLRLGFGAWLVPAGLNHFIGLFPQPPGNQVQSQEVLAALIASGLFSLVKAVELAAGLALVFGRYVPLALAILLPVSFNVWFWDVQLQGWTSVSAWYGWAVLGANVLLCLAWWPSYRATLTHSHPPRLSAARLLFGVLAVAGGANWLFGHWLAVPQASHPLAVQLLTALDHSGLAGVGFGILLAGGVLLLAGRFVPLALAAMLPVTIGALFWALVLDQHPVWAPVAGLMVALNGGLMLAHLSEYRPMLAQRPLAIGEDHDPGGRYEHLFSDLHGNVPLPALATGLVLLVLAYAFYWVLLPPILGYWNMVALVVPG